MANKNVWFIMVHMCDRSKIRANLLCAVFVIASCILPALAVFSEAYGQSQVQTNSKSQAKQPRQSKLAAAGVVKRLDIEQIKFFEEKIRPLLAEHCYKCHGNKKQKGDLRVDSLASLIKGGSTAGAIKPGDVEGSLLVTAIRHVDPELKMPKKKLAARQIAAIETWIKMGAPWPGVKPNAGGDAVESAQTKSDGVPAVRTGNTINDKDRAYWFYQPLSHPKIPELPKSIQASDQDRLRNPIDRFVVKKLNAHGISVAKQADRLTLIRRATFDLTGLPPTAGEVDRFIKDKSPDAYEQLIDRLLASPRYGERWARHWLDLVRYADSNGFKTDEYRPHIWRYRDWVIQALNDDMPYDRFVQKQIAGDELFPDEADSMVALGYLRLWPYETNQRDVYKQWGEILDDVTKVSSEVFLGMSMGCARCHNHKFDPILKEDYYSLRAYFAPLMPDDSLVVASAKQLEANRKQLGKWQEATKKIREQISAIVEPVRIGAEKPSLVKFEPRIQAIMAKKPTDSSPLHQQIQYLAQLQLLREHNRIEGRIKGEARKKLDALRAELKTYDHLKPAALPQVMAIRDVSKVAPQVVVPGRGGQSNIAPGVPSVLNSRLPAIKPNEGVYPSTGRRGALAHWLTNPTNRLSMRVIVNRLWQYHFGVGIVATANDFGHLGQPPSHPQLLDWLANELVDRKFSMKQMHKLMMTSATYKQVSSVVTSDKMRRVDLENRLLWRYPVRRLSAEELRDAMLLVSGEIDTKMGGPGEKETTKRRSVYLKFMRNTRPSMSMAFDGPDGFNSIARRVDTTTAPQALLLMNGKWAVARAVEMAKRIEEESKLKIKASGESADANAILTKQIEVVFLKAYGRLSTQEELAGARNFVKENALATLCHVLLNSNEFLYVD
jgi:hypothetical protein